MFTARCSLGEEANNKPDNIRLSERHFLYYPRPSCVHEQESTTQWRQQKMVIMVMRTTMTMTRTSLGVGFLVTRFHNVDHVRTAIKR